MKLRKEYFEQIKNGEKTFEYRLYDEKRSQIQKGDFIRFTCEQETLLCLVTNLIRASSFEELGVDPCLMRKFYSIEDECKYGVVAIQIVVQKDI